MQAKLPGNLHLEYESFGANSAPAILLIMGLGAQLLRWNIEICEGLAAQGYRVIRFDNRDCGRSSWMDGAPIPDIGAAMRHGTQLEVPYTLEDMAADSLALLDALSIPAAHIVGISMGGAIAQIIATQQPERTLSLTCLLASSGKPGLPGPTPEAAAALFAPLPRDRGRDSIVADGIRRYLAVASPSYPTEPARLQSMFEQEYERGFYPQGVARQLAAIIANGDRSSLLGKIGVPTLVIHGADDPLIPAACGQDIARQVSGAELLLIEGMGHDLPEALSGQLVDAIATFAGRQGADAGRQ
jgi:pimeloyl-ACP methyl ester carboxylesterase